MKRLSVALALLLVSAIGYSGTALAHHELPSEVDQLLDEHKPAPATQPGDPMYTADDEHSPNMKLVGNLPYASGSDLAFEGSTVVAGNFDTPGGLRLIDASDPRAPELLGQLNCPGPQNDVAIWGDLAFLSVDSPRSSPNCGAGAASSAAIGAGNVQEAWEGLRVVDVSDPTSPAQIAAVYTDCGSHTHTIVPDLANERLLVYVHSYPLTQQGARCNPVTHRKISVVEVPLEDPAAARVVSTPDVSPAIGCHDTTVLLPLKIAASACITESQIWALDELEGVPASAGASLENPKVIARIRDPRINIHHSSAFAWDGKTLVLGDEFAGAAVNSPCTGAGADHLPIGALWFYDVTNPANPQQLSFYRIPEIPMPRCGAHNFSPVPLATGKDVLVGSWYEGGTGAIDFTDPRNPTRIGYYIPRNPQTEHFSSYWYNGFIYANNFAHGRGLDVLRMRDGALKGAMELDRMNPQTQDFLIRDKTPAKGRR